MKKVSRRNKKSGFGGTGNDNISNLDGSDNLSDNSDISRTTPPGTIIRSTERSKSAYSANASALSPNGLAAQYNVYNP